MNQCKYCSNETINQQFCSKSCQAKYNAEQNRNTYVEFICQKHKYLKKVRTTELKRTKCPYCQEQKLVQSVKGKVCQKCGTPIQKHIGTGRFCSRACANSRIHSEQTKNKIARTLKQDNNINYRKDCIICGKSFLSNRIRTCSSGCLHQLNKINAIQRNKSPQTRQKLSQAQKKLVRNGVHKGWNNRKIISYPQKFFMEVLNNNGIEYIHNYKVLQKQLDQSLNSCFFLDFYLPKYNVDLQIDGKQHKYIDRVQQDARRDSLLSKKYNIYRVDWNQINSQNGKQLMKEKIDKFIQYIQGVV